MEYPGHLVSASGVVADPSKVADMINWPIPNDVKGMRGFLGLIGYYHKLIKDYEKIACPLMQQLKKDIFAWESSTCI